METTTKDEVTACGRYVLTEADPALAPIEYLAVQSFLARFPATDVAPGFANIRAERYRKLVDAYHAKAKVAEYVYENLVPTCGRSVLAQRLAGTTTYTGTINYAAIGTNPATPTNGDTTLGTETYRQTLSSQTYVNNIAYLSVFIAAGSGSGTLYEGGLFIDGTASADTGQLFSHVLFSPQIVKAAANSLTCDVSITLL